MNPEILDELAKRLAAALPADLARLQDDARKNFRAILGAAFARMSLVTREEFDAQQAVLARTRQKLERLQARLEAMEQSAMKKA